MTLHELLKTLLIIVAVAAGLLLLLVGALVLFESREEGRAPRQVTGRGMIGMGCLLVLMASVFWTRLLFPDLPWHLVRGYRAGGRVESWQVIVVAAGLTLMGVRAIVWGRRARGRERAERPQ